MTTLFDLVHCNLESIVRNRNRNPRKVKAQAANSAELVVGSICLQNELARLTGTAVLRKILGGLA